MRSSFLWNPSGLRETQLGGLLFVFGNWRRCSRSQATSITTVVFSNLAWCTYLAPGHLGPLHPCLGLQPGDPGADLRSLRWPETAERFNTDMLNMMALKAASPPSEQALGGRVRCHIRGRKLNQSE